MSSKYWATGTQEWGFEEHATQRTCCIRLRRRVPVYVPWLQGLTGQPRTADVPWGMMVKDEVTQNWWSADDDDDDDDDDAGGGGGVDDDEGGGTWLFIVIATLPLSQD